MKTIFFILLSMYITTSNAQILNIIDYFEKQLIRRTVADCTTGQNLTNTQYDDLKAQSKLKMNAVSLTHYVNGTEVRYLLPAALEGIKSSKTYDKSKPLTIILHGYFGNILILSPVHVEILNQLKILNNTNLFVMDNNVFFTENYYSAVTNTRFIGEALGELLANLYKSGFSNFHLIGHSLGSHVAGFTGKTYTNLTGKKIDRISGVDPAGPCFFLQPTDKRLTPSDANFVDVIHTDVNTLGINISLGHVDFYPNSGENMPGCILAGCHHNMAPKYFAESISNNNFIAVKCPSWNIFKTGACSLNDQKLMGYWTPTTARGNYYLKTNARSKYAMGINGIRP